MKSGFKVLIFSMLVSLLFAGGAWAFPIGTDDQVRMYANGDFYRMDLLAFDNAGQETVSNSFNTFCLEKSETFIDGYLYDVDSVGGTAFNGGVGAVAGGGDEVSDNSRNFYGAYFDGLFSGYTDLDVQHAIWFEEQEITDYQSTHSALLQIVTTNSYDYRLEGWDINAVNLSKNGVLKQSQLVGVRVPEPATMLLLGTGLLGLVGLSRRKFKK